MNGSVPCTERLTMRPFEWGDLDNVDALHNDPEVMRYVNNGRPSPRTAVIDEVLSWIETSTDGSGHGFWAAHASSNGRFVGWFHLRPGPSAPDEGLELGFRLRRCCWGRGLATEGSRVLIDAGFAALGARRIFAHTMAIHRASRRVLEKAGLQFVRTFDAEWPVRIPGDEYGDVEYALTYPSWAARIAEVESR